MKKQMKVLSVAITLVSSLLTSQVRNFVIEPSLKPNLYLYKTFGTFAGKEYSTNALYLITKKGVVLFDVPWQKNTISKLNGYHQKKA